MVRVLGLDVGERRIGVALSDALGLTAQRLTVIERASTAGAIEALVTLAQRHHAQQIVIGLPLSLQGARGPQAQRVAAFGDALRRQTTLPIHFVDERLTTRQGERVLAQTGSSSRRRKQLIDQVAAQLILQHFLDAQRQHHA